MHASTQYCPAQTILIFSLHPYYLYIMESVLPYFVVAVDTLGPRKCVLVPFVCKSSFFLKLNNFITKSNNIYGEWRFDAYEHQWSRFFKKIKNHIFKIQKIMKKLFGCSQLFILQTRKISYLNTLYFRLHKNDKRVDLLYTFSNLQMLP
jgi:hypothetical protein